jgi:hypothetical protein
MSMMCAAPNSCGFCQRTVPCMAGKCAYLIEAGYKVVLTNTTMQPEQEHKYDPAFASHPLNGVEQ